VSELPEPEPPTLSVRTFRESVVAFGKARWPLLLVSTLAMVFLTFWLFDVGEGPLDGDRVGTLGEWVSGVATAATLAVTLAVLLHDRHQADQRRRFEAMKRKMDELVGEDRRSEREVPVVWTMTRVAPGPAAGSPQYRLSVAVVNGSPVPLASLRMVFRTAGRLTGDEWERLTEIAEQLRSEGDEAALADLIARIPLSTPILQRDVLPAGDQASGEVLLDLTDEDAEKGEFAGEWFVAGRRFTDHRYSSGKQYRMSFKKT
jgi:hypothetical protein